MRGGGQRGGRVQGQHHDQDIQEKPGTERDKPLCRSEVFTKIQGEIFGVMSLTTMRRSGHKFPTVNQGALLTSLQMMRPDIKVKVNVSITPV